MVVSMDTLRRRADDLRRLPKVTPLRVFWILRREFPTAERYQLVNAAKLEGYHRGISPGWGRGHPVPVRWHTKGRPVQPVTIKTRKVVAMDYPVMTIQARGLQKGDWIEGEGMAQKVGNYTTMVLVWFSTYHKFFQPLDHVKVRLEDHGQTE